VPTERLIPGGEGDMDMGLTFHNQAVHGEDFDPAFPPAKVLL